MLKLKHGLLVLYNTRHNAAYAAFTSTLFMEKNLVTEISVYTYFVKITYPTVLAFKILFLLLHFDEDYMLCACVTYLIYNKNVLYLQW